MNPGSRVLDLGCSPGAWLQIACKYLGPKSRGGHVLGIDIQVCVALHWHFISLHCNLTLSVLAADYLTCVTQDVVLPKEHCDDRVEFMQADARTLNIHELYTKFEVVLQHVQRFANIFR